MLTSQLLQGPIHTLSLASWLLAISHLPCPLYRSKEPALHIPALEHTLSLFAEAITKYSRTPDNPDLRAEGILGRVGKRTGRAEGGWEPSGGRHRLRLKPHHIPTPEGQ